jgi:nickel-dependent lactate racemase
MAGFSGGPKSICPGLASLETVKNFHGHAFLKNPKACNANQKNNPCYNESLSIAKTAGVDFAINVVLNKKREIVRAFAGDLAQVHEAACTFVKKHACPEVKKEADVVITSCGGSPLDATFYQCVKGMVSSLPAVKKNGTVICFGSCTEKVGSPEYAGLMRKYCGERKRFLLDIQKKDFFIKDQWQFQMQCRVLEKVGEKGLVFFTDGLDKKTLDFLSVSGNAVHSDQLTKQVQQYINSLAAQNITFAAMPEGPYCAPVRK